MARKNYVVISQTINPEDSMVLCTGLLGSFSSLNKAIIAVNAELKKMKAPQDYELMEKVKCCTFVPVGSNAMYAEKDYEYYVQITVYTVETNRIYTNEDKLV